MVNPPFNLLNVVNVFLVVALWLSLFSPYSICLTRKDLVSCDRLEVVRNLYYVHLSGLIMKIRHFIVLNQAHVHPFNDLYAGDEAGAFRFERCSCSNAF